MDVIRNYLIWMIDMNFYQSKKPDLDYKRSQIKC